VQKTSLERDLAARIDGEVRVDLGSRSTCEEPNSRVVGQRVTNSRMPSRSCSAAR
jgi:hypothetical protein